MQTLQRQFLGVLISLLALRGAAADDLRVLPDGQLPKDARLEPLQGSESATSPSRRRRSKEAWEARAEQMRRQILVAAGLWPMPEKTPLNPVIHGKVDREGYTVEKVYFESYPGHFVTGSLYRPKGRTGKLPVVLAPYGHWANGRFFDAGPDEIRREIVRGAERFEVGGRYILQALCVQLARMGCVVFQYDMVGVADSQQVPHTPEVAAETDTPDRWGFASPQAEARLQTNFGLQTYNSIRALDFVCGLPDVDPSRIGMTGASGGGTQTFILCGHRSPPGGRLSGGDGLDGHARRLQLRKRPVSADRHGQCRIRRPVRPQAARHDRRQRLDQEMRDQRFSRTQAALSNFSARKDNVMLKPLLQFGHNYNYVSRAVIYSWFNKHLKLGLDGPDRRGRFQAAHDPRDERLGRRASRPAQGLRPSTSVFARLGRSDRKSRSTRSRRKMKPR